MGDSNSIKYDCTNLENGRSSLDQCESLNPFLYPFVLMDSMVDLSEDNVDAEVESSNNASVGVMDTGGSSSSANTVIAVKGRILSSALMILGTLLASLL